MVSVGSRFCKKAVYPAFAGRQLSSANKSLFVSIAVVAAFAASAVVAFGKGEDPAITQARETEALIQEERAQLDELLRSQAPDKYPNGLAYEAEAIKGSEIVNIYDGTKLTVEEFEKIMNSLSEEQKEQYEQWTELGRQHIGYYKRQINEILTGTIEKQRVTVKEAAALIEKTASFDDQLAGLQKLHGTPDFIGGSGITRHEYWLDDTGNDKIVVLIEQRDILHGTVKMN